MNNTSKAAQVIKAIGSATVDIILVTGLVMFFCGPTILPWYKRR